MTKKLKKKGRTAGQCGPQQNQKQKSSVEDILSQVLEAEGKNLVIYVRGNLNVNRADPDSYQTYVNVNGDLPQVADLVNRPNQPNQPNRPNRPNQPNQPKRSDSLDPSHTLDPSDSLDLSDSSDLSDTLIPSDSSNPSDLSDFSDPSRPFGPSVQSNPLGGESDKAAEDAPDVRVGMLPADKIGPRFLTVQQAEARLDVAVKMLQGYIPVTPDVIEILRRLMYAKDSTAVKSVIGELYFKHFLDVRNRDVVFCSLKVLGPLLGLICDRTGKGMSYDNLYRQVHNEVVVSIEKNIHKAKVLEKRNHSSDDE